MTEIRIEPASTALLLMDAEPAEDDQAADTLARSPSLPVIQALLGAARQHGLLVVHARRASGMDSPEADEPRPEPVAEAAADGSDHTPLPPPLLGEPVVDVTACQSLQQIHLERILVAGGIRTVLLAGHTNADHLSHALGPVLAGGYRYLFVRDACHRPLPGLRRPAQREPMDGHDIGTSVVHSAEVLAALRSASGTMP